jgi:ABC-2 type transport system permease protein
MNIFFRELKANFKSLIIWSVIVLLFVVVGVSKFSAYYNNPEMLKILDSMPKPLLQMFDMMAFNLTTVTGFFGLMFTYFALMVCIASAMWGADVIAKESRDKTVDFSLPLPVTRSRLITAKSLAALVNCIVLLLVTWGASLAAAQQYNPDAAFYKFLTLEMVALGVMELIFLSVGVFLGCAMKQYRRVSSVAVSLLLLTYFMSVISGMNENLEFLKYFTPFKYFNPSLMLHESRMDGGFLLLSFAIILLCMAGAYWTYAKRDLYI